MTNTNTLLSSLTNHAWTRAAIDVLNRAKSGETIFYYIENKSSQAGTTFINYINEIVRLIDNKIDLDFRRTLNHQASDIDFHVADYRSQLGQGTVGRCSRENSYFRIDVLMTGGDSNFNRNTVIHELGHALGLAEIGNDSRWDQDNTMMSYLEGQSTPWRTNLSSTDLTALRKLHGRENEVIRYAGDGLHDGLAGSNRGDNIYGYEGNDVIDGRGGNDKLYGGSGHDRLIGNTGNDYLNGGSNHDKLYGGSGNDHLIGGGGNDLLIGGSGYDNLWGQSGRDTFVVKRGTGYSIIKDFRDGQDRILLGTGRSGLRMCYQNNDALLYQRGDLLTVIEDAAGELQLRGNYLV